jgi:hypothetical protein
MLTSTAGELSIDVASAAPVASARTFDVETGDPERAGSFSFSATSQWRPKRRTLPNIFVSPGSRLQARGSMLSVEA